MWHLCFASAIRNINVCLKVKESAYAMRVASSRSCDGDPTTVTINSVDHSQRVPRQVNPEIIVQQLVLVDALLHPAMPPAATVISAKLP